MKMNIDIIMQMVSIIGNSLVVLFFWERLNYMDFSFWRIFARAAFHHDFKPLDWLIDNMEYLGFLMVIIGHSSNVLALLQQFGLNQIHTKPTLFFVSSPMNSIGILMMGYIYAHRTTKNYYSR